MYSAIERSWWKVLATSVVRRAARRSRPCRCPRRRRGSAAASRAAAAISAVNRPPTIDVGVAQGRPAARLPDASRTLGARAAARPRTARDAGPGCGRRRRPSCQLAAAPGACCRTSSRAPGTAWRSTSSRPPSPSRWYSSWAAATASVVEFDTEAGRSRHGEVAVDDLERLLGDALAVLPDPVGVDGGDVARRRGGDVGEHRQRHVEVVVGVRTPRQAPRVAELRDAHRSGHGPEVRVGERDVDGAGADRVAHLAPVGARSCSSRSAGRWRA